MPHVLALDQGTTSCRAIVFDERGAVAGVAQQEFDQSYPRAGWVEHDARQIWQTQLRVARQVLDDCELQPDDIAAIGITNQRETTVVWDQRTGEPIGPAIVWQDRRTSEYCRQLVRDGWAEKTADKTGLVIDAYFSASKIRWLLEHVDGARRRAERGELLFGTIDSWLLWNLTGGQVHATDITNASRTMLLNLRTGQWDEQLLELFGVPVAMLPRVCSSSEIYGRTTSECFGKSITIAGMAGDQQAALFGQTCFKRGMAKNTFGTGCFMLMNIGDEPTASRHKLLTTAAWKLGERATYALEGSVFIGGAVVQWLRDGLGLIKSAAEIETLARSVDDSGGVYLVPTFAGMGAPYWDQYARGTITGLTRGTTAGHLARAALEGIAHQVADVLEVMIEDSGVKITELRVDGGAAANDLLMQFQADMLSVPVVRPKVLETTALGAAYMAGLASGVWHDLREIEANWQMDRVFESAMNGDEVRHRRSRWRAALQRARDWAEHDESEAK